MTRSPAFSFPALGKHGVVYGLGIVANKAVAFILLPVYTRFLTPTDYGVLQLVVMVMEVVGIVAGSRLAMGVFRFYHKAESEREKRSVLTTALGLLVVSYGLTALLTIVAAPLIAEFVFGVDEGHANYIRIAVLAMACESLFLVPLAYLQLQTRSTLFVSVQFAKLILQASLNIIFLIPFGMGVMGVLLSGLIGNALIGLFLAGLLIKENGFTPAVGPARDLVRFGLPLVVTQIATMLLMFGDRYFLNRAVDAAAVGLYSLAHQFGLLLVLVGYIPFEQIWNPTRFEVAKRPDRDRIYSNAFTYMNVLLVTAAVGIGLFGYDVIRIMAAPPFHAAATYIPVLLLVFVLQCWMSFHNFGLMISERTSWYAVANWIGAGVALAGFFILIPRFGAWGAAHTAAIAFFVRFIIVYAMSQYFWHIPYRWRPTGFLMGAGAAVVGSTYFTGELSLAASITLRISLFGLFLGSVWWLPILTRGERESVRSLLSQGLARLRSVRDVPGD